MIRIAIRKNLPDNHPAELELLWLPAGQYSVRLLGVAVGFARTELEALQLPRVRAYLEIHNPTLLENSP